MMFFECARELQYASRNQMHISCMHFIWQDEASDAQTNDNKGGEQ